MPHYVLTIAEAVSSLSSPPHYEATYGPGQKCAAPDDGKVRLLPPDVSLRGSAVPDDVFTPRSSPRGRSEQIVEARRGNKLEKRINRCLAERQTDLPTPGPDTHTHLFPWAVLDWYAEPERERERRTEKDLAYK